MVEYGKIIQIKKENVQRPGRDDFFTKLHKIPFYFVYKQHVIVSHPELY